MPLGFLKLAKKALDQKFQELNEQSYIFEACLHIIITRSKIIDMMYI
jgi:hypothetical protein